jgi:hypothetical protein
MCTAKNAASSHTTTRGTLKMGSRRLKWGGVPGNAG